MVSSILLPQAAGAVGERFSGLYFRFNVFASIIRWSGGRDTVAELGQK